MNGLIKLFLGFFISVLLYVPSTYAECARVDHAHADANVTRCCYCQEDLMRMVQQDAERHQEVGRSDACIFCGCLIEEHTRRQH